LDWQLKVIEESFGMNELLLDADAYRKASRLLGELLADYEENLLNWCAFPSFREASKH